MAGSASVITPVWLRSVHGMAGSASTTVYELPTKSRVELPAPGGEFLENFFGQFGINFLP